MGHCFMPSFSGISLNLSCSNLEGINPEAAILGRQKLEKRGEPGKMSEEFQPGQCLWHSGGETRNYT